MPQAFPFDVDTTSPSDEFTAISELDNERVADNKDTTKKTVDTAKDDDDTDLPAHYKGKSKKDIIKMHQNAEELIRRHSEEVGFARRMAEAAAAKLNTTQVQQPVVSSEESKVDFFADPDAAVSKKIESHPAVVEARMTVAEMRKAEAFRQLQQAHGNPQDITSDPSFREWLSANPRRVAQLQKASESFDADTTIEIFDNFKRDKKLAELESGTTKDELDSKRKESKQAGKVDSGNSPSSKQGKKIYRKQDIINLQISDPAKYERLEPEILAAYAEGRVR